MEGSSPPRVNRVAERCQAVPRWGSANFHQLTRKEKAHEHYCDRYRSGQERICGSRGQSGGSGAERTACLNRIRGLLSEFGIVLPLKAEVVRRQAREHLEDLPGYANLVIGDLLSEVSHLDERIKQYDAHVRAMARQCTAAQQLMQLMGVGETTATAVVAMVGNASEFNCGRQFSAWIGLVPGQYSSGGKARLGRITKAGDPYLRSLLVMGARAVLNSAKGKTDSLSRWAVAVEQRRGYWRAVVAIAAKNARLISRVRHQPP